MIEEGLCSDSTSRDWEEVVKLLEKKTNGENKTEQKSELEKNENWTKENKTDSKQSTLMFFIKKKEWNNTVDVLLL